MLVAVVAALMMHQPVLVVAPAQAAAPAAVVEIPLLYLTEGLVAAVLDQVVLELQEMEVLVLQVS